ncbi:MAG TPA: FAD-dependent oxidoreductase [Pyrinomonadaceae bacterium]|jgi:2-polyprenyl-6-methoxyphenol hydroxylase-like FAD-dependent oxidoreductase
MSERAIEETLETACCIVGGGPAGATLALILARQRIPVVLLEAHEDFERDFRGDTIHPSGLEILDELGLAARLHELRHSKIRNAAFMTPAGTLTLADFGRLDTRFPYIMMLPQAHFLQFLTDEAKRYPNFQLRMGARVEELIAEDGAVRGVRYETDAGVHEVRAHLTIAADGRNSRVRHLTGMEARKTSPPMDVLWFRLPRREDEPEGVLARVGGGHIAVMLDRLDEWQIAYVILKGSYRQVREAGLDALRASLVAVAPELADRVAHLKEWKQVAMLSVESSRLEKWYQPGLLLIGDAAHVMSPVGGVGINYAIQDAVVAANTLAAPLAANSVELRHLREVQRQRALPTRFIQALQSLVQRRIIANALLTNQPLQVPLVARLFLRTPLLRDLPARLIAFGLRRIHVKPSLRPPAP